MTNGIERSYGKLYDPSAADTFIWNVVPKNYKAGTAATYVATRHPDPMPLVNQGFVLVNSVQMGRYDQDGFYHTYKPPVEGVVVGKYVRVLQDHEVIDAKNQYDRKKIYDRYPAKQPMEVS